MPSRFAIDKEKVMEMSTVYHAERVPTMIVKSIEDTKKKMEPNGHYQLTR